MKEKARLFTGSFFAALIFVGALCGFAAVDLSIDRYMPGQFGAMLRLNSIDESGIGFDFMGKSYEVKTSSFEGAYRFIWKNQAYLPVLPRAVSALTEKVYNAVEERVVSRE